jgi:hypothetical protein
MQRIHQRFEKMRQTKAPCTCHQRRRRQHHSRQCLLRQANAVDRQPQLLEQLHIFKHAYIKRIDTEAGFFTSWFSTLFIPESDVNQLSGFSLAPQLRKISLLVRADLRALASAGRSPRLAEGAGAAVAPVAGVCPWSFTCWPMNHQPRKDKVTETTRKTARANTANKTKTTNNKTFK